MQQPQRTLSVGSPERVRGRKRAWREVGACQRLEQAQDPCGRGVGMCCESAGTGLKFLQPFVCLCLCPCLCPCSGPAGKWPPVVHASRPCRDLHTLFTIRSAGGRTHLHEMEEGCKRGCKSVGGAREDFRSVVQWYIGAGSAVTGGQAWKLWHSHNA
jgi:hypothetical protein